MQRREFITLLGGRRRRGRSRGARSSRQKRYRIGMLETVSPALNTAHLDAFRNGLRELGYVEGQRYTIEYRSADGRAERFPDLAAELVRLGVDLIVVRGTPAAIAAKNATRTIPVVMASVGEPLLIVDSLARPGRNVTGLSAFVNVMTSKRLELTRELVPAIITDCAISQYEQPGCSTSMGRDENGGAVIGYRGRASRCAKPRRHGRAFETARDSASTHSW